MRLGSAGMRGIVGSGLDPVHAVDFASAIGTMASGGKILLASDPRASSEMLQLAVRSGLSGCGCEVVDCGVIPAGMMHCLIPAYKAAGGILISGGHQSGGWNALIPLGPDGAYFNRLRQRELFDIYFGRNFSLAASSGIQPCQSLPEDAWEEYLTELERCVNADAIRKAGFRVICDFCNGAGGRVAARWAKRFSIRLISLNEQHSGVLAHDPEPRPRSGSVVASIIKELQGDAGFVFNSDVSRMEIVTDSGEPLTEELTCALGIDYLLCQSGPGERVITNICTTSTLSDAVKRRKGILERCAVGQSQVIDAMAVSGARFSGEGSGCFACTPSIRGFDGFLMALVILESMAVRKMTLTELAASLPRYSIVKQNLAFPAQNGYALLREMPRLFPKAKVSEQDGLRFDFEDGWISLRISSTEPILRMIAEAKDRAEALSRIRLVRNTLENKI